jgi:hypothetical protein
MQVRSCLIHLAIKNTTVKTELKIIANIEQIKLISKIFEIYTSEILFCSSHRVEHNDENKI